MYVLFKNNNSYVVYCNVSNWRLNNFIYKKSIWQIIMLTISNFNGGYSKFIYLVYYLKLKLAFFQVHKSTIY